MRKQLCWSFLTGVSVLAATGCGGEERGDSETTDFVQSNLNVYACAAVDADASFDGHIYPGHTTPQSYNKCDQAYVVDLVDLDEEYTGEGSGADAQINVKYADATIPNRWACQANSITAAFYLWVPGAGVTSTGTGGSETGWQWLSTRQMTGQWNSDTKRCTLSVSLMGLVAGQSYRIAAGALSPDDNTRKMVIRTLPPIGN